MCQFINHVHAQIRRWKGSASPRRSLGSRGGSRMAEVGKPCGFGELMLLLKSIAGGCFPLAALPDQLCCQTWPALYFS